MKKYLIILFSAFSFLIKAQSYSQYVNVFIGTDGTGHTFPGPSMPFGMVQPGPDNGEFVLGSPQVKKASIHFSNGKKFDIVANNFSDAAIYNEIRQLNNKVIKNLL